MVISNVGQDLGDLDQVSPNFGKFSDIQRQI